MAGCARAVRCAGVSARVFEFGIRIGFNAPSSRGGVDQSAKYDGVFHAIGATDGDGFARSCGLDVGRDEHGYNGACGNGGCDGKFHGVDGDAKRNVHSDGDEHERLDENSGDDGDGDGAGTSGRDDSAAGGTVQRSGAGGDECDGAVQHGHFLWIKDLGASGADVGRTVSLLVAGMLANTAYHMRAVVQATDGTMATDVDHVFTTTAVAVAQQPKLTVTTAPGASPQSGVEILDLATGYPGSSLAVVDLQGRLLWSYPWQGTISDLLQGVHLLPNGHLLMDISETSDEPVAKPAVAGTIQVLREIDLTGATIREESLDALNAALPAAGMNFTVLTFHHDVIQLPNGHWIALGSILQPCTGMPYVCPTYPNLLGDVIIDLAPQTDGTFLPVWSWNTFDHLDTSRALEGYPDWTHSNALLYSADDGNLLLSMRHQSWIIKIDYANGKGAGDILWKLGEGGDFTLMGGTDPQDWFYAEHGPSFVSTNTTGKFQLAVMDNGNVRVYPTGQTCASVGEPTCPYSTSEVYEIDETAKTATILTKYGPGEFSLWGGNSEQLTNGNLESDFNAGAPAGLSDIFETTQGTSPEVVWQLRTLGQNAYRGFRLPSLYPGVQW